MTALATLVFFGTHTHRHTGAHTCTRTHICTHNQTHKHAHTQSHMVCVYTCLCVYSYVFVSVGCAATYGMDPKGCTCVTSNHLSQPLCTDYI